MANINSRWYYQFVVSRLVYTPKGGKFLEWARSRCSAVLLVCTLEQEFFINPFRELACIIMRSIFFCLNQSRTSTPRYLIFPSFRVSMASWTPSCVMGNLTIVGLISCRDANRSRSTIVRREAVRDPLMEAPRPINPTRSTGACSLETVKGYTVPLMARSLTRLQCFVSKGGVHGGN